ncbi:hypothetical protein GCM10022291_23500 [Postechiella marina]|uniref:HYR domain-containing protein n=1 Tax=Postechiella marina TaxID=943941 RepID=A0ABP8CBR5_9FLAO
MIKNNLTKAFLLLLLISLFTCSNSDNDTEEKEQDTILPTLSCPTTINVTIDVFTNEAIVNYTTPIGTDNLDGVTTNQIAGLASGDSYPIGTTTNTYQAKDAAGNITTCSFDVIVTQSEASANLPYFINTNPTPTGKKWTKVENMSDEFEGITFNDAKWHRDPATDPFGWYGRPPALFDSDNVTVSDGNLNITVLKYDTPKTVKGTTWTHGGAILRSKEKAKYGMYYECRMQANKTVMSSTFWIAFLQNCNSGPVRKLELDIQECVGRVHSGTQSWAKNFANIYASNTWRHDRDCDTEVTGAKQSPAKTILSEKNNSRFFVYGCWWKSPTEILFYLDGELSHSITNPPANFDLEGHITMAIETYNWNPIEDNGGIFETGSFDDLTTKYDWVRTWKLEDN